jgi:hypothetical protein
MKESNEQDCIWGNGGPVHFACRKEAACSKQFSQFLTWVCPQG